MYAQNDFLEVKGAYLKHLKVSDAIEAKLVEKISHLNVEQKQSLLELIEKGQLQMKEKYCANEALALFLAAKLSTGQYDLIRKSAAAINCYIYPTYRTLWEAKQECYPPSIKATEDGASVNLQHLLDTTVTQLLSISKIDSVEPNELQLISKCGMDGASSQSCYNQICDDEEFSDKSMFMISLVGFVIFKKMSSFLYTLSFC